MHRSKRDPSTKAYAKGYNAGLTGRSRDNCPYGEASNTSQDIRQNWLSGWREAKTAQWQ